MSKFMVDDKQCAKHNISLSAVYYLISLYKNSPITAATFQELGSTGYLDYKGYDAKGYLIEPTITERGMNLLSDIFSEKNLSTYDIKRFEGIATKMRELFPKGKKEGTNHMWRDSVPVIARRLKLLFAKYDQLYTEKDILDATKRYVDSFNGNYRFMQLLKYFISKQKIEDGVTTEESQLLSYLANAGQEETTSQDWDLTLK